MIEVDDFFFFFLIYKGEWYVKVNLTYVSS